MLYDVRTFGGKNSPQMIGVESMIDDKCLSVNCMKQLEK